MLPWVWGMWNRPLFLLSRSPPADRHQRQVGILLGISFLGNLGCIRLFETWTLLLIYFWDRVSHILLGWPQACYLNLDPFISASWMPELQAYITTLVDVVYASRPPGLCLFRQVLEELSCSPRLGLALRHKATTQRSQSFYHRPVCL